MSATRDDLIRLRDEKRALDAVARTLCDCHFTDGFCRPDHTPECRCNNLAKSCLAAIKGRGMDLVWTCSPERRAEAKDPAE